MHVFGGHAFSWKISRTNQSLFEISMKEKKNLEMAHITLACPVSYMLLTSY